MKKIKLVGTSDLDDVLLNTQEQMTKYVNRVMGLGIDLDFWQHDDYASLFGVSRPEARRIAKDFHASPEFADVRPHAGALEAVADLTATLDELHISTSRPAHLHEMTPLSVMTHFPGIAFSGIHFSNKYDEHLPRSSKADVGKKLGAKVHIDDVLSHAEDCAAVCEEVYLVDFTWNRHARILHKNIVRVKTFVQASALIRWRLR
jgi:hypothetical protein